MEILAHNLYRAIRHPPTLRRRPQEFEYLGPLGPSRNSPFLVKPKSSGDMDVVRFAVRYFVGAQ